MSAWSAQRKLLIVLTIVVIAGFILSGVLFLILHKPPTCDDGIQNGIEDGIDCGGVCPAICPVEPKKLFDEWVRVFPITKGVYSAVAYVVNQNADLYVPEVQFEMEVYDEEGKRITRASQTTPIMPNGITPVFVPRILTYEREAKTVSFRLVEEPRFVKTTQQNDDFILTDVYFEASEDEPPYVRATARNIGEGPVKRTDFIVILYDEDGVAITASRTFEKNIEPQGTRVLQYSWVQPLELRKGPCASGTCTKEIKRVEIVPVVLEW